MTDAPTPGTLRMYDAARPTLSDGPHRIRVVTTVEQSTDGSTWKPLDTGLSPSDSFVAVTGAEYRLAADAVLVSHPAANSAGDYGDTLPHVVLRDRSLPWQRTVEGTETGTPWLAMLVFDAGEFTITRGATAADGQVYDTVTATEAGWRAVLPRRADMSLLCHVRQVNVDDRELAAGDDDGWVAVVTANRVPDTGQTHRACLVSLAGHQDLLDAADTGAPTLPSANLPLLHDWGFSVSDGGTFHDVMAGVATRSAALGISPAHPILLSRTDREGASGQARYHGPLAGAGTGPRDDAPDLSADAAAQLGRLLAAADRSLIRELSEWHRMDLLDAEETGRMSAAAESGTTPEVAVQRLTAFRANPWGVPSVAGGRGPTRPAPKDATVPDAARIDPVAAGAVGRPAPLPSRVAALSARVRAVTGSGQRPTAPPPAVAAALANFALLRGLPLTYLIPQLTLLPDESIRFFTIDHGWLDALATGLLSAGGTGTRATAFAARNAGPARAQVRANLRRTAAALQTARAQADDTVPIARARIRDAAVAADPASTDERTTAAAATDLDSETITGLLLRSSAVSRWPQLEVRAFAAPAPAPDADPAGLTPLAPLRLERLTPSLLLALFAGTPAAVWIEEPHHGLQLGFDRDPANGTLTLPSRLTGGTIVTVPVRGAQARLIDVPGVATALAGQPGEPPTVGPGALAAALIRPPFRQVFQ